MKSAVLSLSMVLLVVSLALAGCSKPAPAPAPAPVPVPAPAPAPVPVPAPAPAPAPKPAPKPAPAPAPAPAPTPSPAAVHEKELAKWVEGAKKEGKLVYWATGRGKEIAGIVEEFNKKYPFIEVETWRGNTDDQFEKLFAEHKAGKYTVDLFTADPEYLPLLLENNLLRKMPMYYVDNWVKEHNDPDGFYWVQSYLSLVIEYNTNLVKPEDVPKTFEELTQPKWKGKVAIEQNAMHWFLGLVQKWGWDKATEFIKQMKANEALLYRGHTNIRDLNTAGEFPIAAEMYLYRIVQDMEQKGSPIDWVAPFVPSPIMYSASLKGSPNPNASRVWHDWITSPEGQAFYADFTFRTVGDLRVPSIENKAIAAKGGPERVGVPGLFQGANAQRAQDIFRDNLWPK